MKELYQNIYAWTKAPDDSELNLKPGRKFQQVFQMLLLWFLLVIPYMGLMLLVHHHLIKLETPLIEESFLEFLFIAVVLAPIIEELIFRFPLKYRRNYLARLLDSLSKGRLKKHWNSIFKYFLALLIIGFGLVHMSNYSNSSTLFYVLAPLIVATQTFGGLLLSYTRIKFGFIWSVFQHGAFNFILISAGAILMHNQELINFSDERMSVDIRELSFIDKATTSYATSYCTDCEENLIYSVEGKNISLYGLMDSLKINGPKPYDNAWINVKINSQEGVTTKEINDILRKEIKFDSE